MLQCHLIIHTGLKPYKCKECQKQFAHNSDALKHQKIHSGIRPFACQLCSSTFVRREHLTRHAKTHNKMHKSTNQLLNHNIYIDREFKQCNAATLVELNGSHIQNVKFDNSGIVDIQFICASLGREEYVEIKSKEELDSIVESLGKERRVKVLIGRENKDGDWEYEEVDTTIEKTVGEPESSIYKEAIQVCYGFILTFSTLKYTLCILLTPEKLWIFYL